MKDQRHPNGAVEIIESVLLRTRRGSDDYERRYARYLQRPARRSGPLRVFELDDSSVTIVPQSELDALLPGEVPSDLPAFVGYGVAVANLSVTRDLLERAELPVRPAPSGGCFVPAAAALGAAVIFRSDHEVAGGADLNVRWWPSVRCRYYVVTKTAAKIVRRRRPSGRAPQTIGWRCTSRSPC